MKRSVPWWGYLLILLPGFVIEFLGRTNVKLWFMLSRWHLGNMDKEEFKHAMMVLSTMSRYDEKCKWVEGKG